MDTGGRDAVTTALAEAVAASTHDFITSAS
jgi:hypothetical protein